ncbi:phosphate starvation-inducible protein PhoH [Methylobacterium sp. Leaf88]|nr:phosphate starvation-inducible protein PhoH [Methylobacterium sp. Leaf88]
MKDDGVPGSEGSSGRGGALRGRGPAARIEGLVETEEVSLTFDDNRLASLVFGQYDQNVAHIERRLAVTATALGNHLVVKGGVEAAEKARKVFERLYARVKASGLPLTLGDVDGAIHETTQQGNLFPAAEVSAEPDRAVFDQLATRKRGAVRARNAAQDAYIKALRSHELVFAEGPAGTGKTWLAVGYAVSLLEQGHVERLILSRPAVEAGERLGFLPGDMREKVDPYLRPIYDALYDFMEARHVDRGLQTGVIEIAPLAFMRGRTLTNAVVLLDEAQNTTSMQMKMFLTRLGENSRMIITGDPSQIDLPPGQKSGLVEAVRVLDGVEGIGRITFRDVDVVRHDLVRRIVTAYETAAHGEGDADRQTVSRRRPLS